ncbi:hypothetical protein Tco_0976917 [Tanacetum coccineum]|uniref:Uncharacterized protein n=1 Tax=Tanacetum coccineum TaxID=301880 RepID=A0ABQ5EIM5_9ASTR
MTATTKTEKSNLPSPLLSKPESFSFTHCCSIVMEYQSDVQNHLVQIQANDHDLLVNSNNENDDMLGYESEKSSDDGDADKTNHAEDADGTNHSDLKLVKRGITRLYKFHREYGKPGGIKIKVTFDALNRVSGLHRALFLSFLGDLVRKHIGLKIISWKKVDKESRDKLWDEITEFQNETERYILPNLNTPSKLNELPTKYSAIVKAEEWVEFVNYTTTDVYKEKSARGRGGYVFVKEKMLCLVRKGRLAEEWDSGGTYMEPFTNKMIGQENLSTEMTQKDVLVNKLSNEMTETKGMLSQLMNQLAAGMKRIFRNKDKKTKHKNNKTEHGDGKDCERQMPTQSGDSKESTEMSTPAKFKSQQ